MFFLKKWFGAEKNIPDKGVLPQHIAIIMDGNGRWAKKRGLPRSIGHREGARTLKKIVASCDKIGIKYLTVYAFSTENWKRPQNEVDTLMSLLLEYLKNAETELGGESVQIRVVGNIKGLPEEIQNEVARVTKMTQRNGGLILNIALNYGGRDELLNVVKETVKDVKSEKLSIDEIDESWISGKLYTSSSPDPDIIIRTSGEKRISNFLLWQSAYSEFWYTDILWPDFKEEHIMEAVKEFQKRNRRFGGV